MQPTTIQLNIQVWQEGTMFVAYVSPLDVSSCGVSLDEARKNIREAVIAFVTEAERMGTLSQVLEEAGFTCDKEWKAPNIVAEERLQLAV